MRLLRPIHPLRRATPPTTSRRCRSARSLSLPIALVALFWAGAASCTRRGPLARSRRSPIFGALADHLLGDVAIGALALLPESSLALYRLWLALYLRALRLPHAARSLPAVAAHASRVAARSATASPSRSRLMTGMPPRGECLRASRPVGVGRALLALALALLEARARALRGVRRLRRCATCASSASSCARRLSSRCSTGSDFVLDGVDVALLDGDRARAAPRPLRRAPPSPAGRGRGAPRRRLVHVPPRRARRRRSAPSLGNVVEHIRKGTLDFVLLKPADAQFLVSTSRFEFFRFVNVVGRPRAPRLRPACAPPRPLARRRSRAPRFSSAGRR